MTFPPSVQSFLSFLGALALCSATKAAEPAPPGPGAEQLTLPAAIAEAAARSPLNRVIAAEVEAARGEALSARVELNGLLGREYSAPLEVAGNLEEPAVTRPANGLIAAALGLIPMLFATGPGSEIQKPLAAVVIGGLISSTLLTLYILPTFYRIFERGEPAPAGVRLPDPPATTELTP